ncbi:hypothetical protein [Vibrio agarivorans]|uniref:Uncharacterized protein n=1 Tax=Vibrio agarivorans TaxID=153622 RepID=A0ABT7Y715_9VIBR|nr:hypothetical protein [Vibrio agarivorans]MDN2483851.1 hypothetical protein [Vibrio agarivorans]
MERDRLINRLRMSVNGREGTSFSNEDIAHYVGSDTNIDTLGEWVFESEHNLSSAVTASDIQGLLD